jgi:hypothetical protein
MSRKEKLMKPSWKTFEFWISLTAMVIGALLASGAFTCGAADACSPTVATVAKILGALGAILAAMGYTWTRSNVKIAAADAIASLSVPANPPKP